MRIFVGKMLEWLDKAHYAIQIDGMPAMGTNGIEDNFEYVELTKKQMIKLREIIDKELDDGQSE